MTCFMSAFLWPCARFVNAVRSHQVFVQVGHLFLQLWGFDVGIWHPHHHHTPVIIYTQKTAFSTVRFRQYATSRRPYAHTCPGHLRNWCPHSSFLRPQRTATLLWARRDLQHTSDKIKRRANSVNRRGTRDEWIVNGDVWAVTVLPGYSGRTRSAPAPPGWLSSAPGRSGKVIVKT